MLPVGASLVHAGGQTGYHDTKITVAFRNIVKASKSHDKLSLSAYASTH